MEDPDAILSKAESFVDRVSELDALRGSLLAHRARMDAGLIDTTELRNVLTFYGEGGAGKSELSRQLQDWAAGTGMPDHWQPAPERPADVTARWDFNDSLGVVDAHDLLATLRSAIGGFRSSWPAFDLAFTAFHQSVRPGTELQFQSPGGGNTTISDVATGLLGDALAAGGFLATGGASAGAMTVGRHLWTRFKERSTVGKAVRAFPGLDQLVLDAEAVQQDREKMAEIAGRLLFMLNREIEAMPPNDRPTIVVFVDHMERLQVSGSRHLGEGVLNRLISRSPWLLFVVTGRNSLRWHTTSDLPASGPRRWPLLSTEEPPTDEPRQHAIGYLSPPDAEAFLEASFCRTGVEVEAGVIEALAVLTDGWPLHLQAIVDLAKELSPERRPLTLPDLDGDLSEIIDRLVSDLPTDVADAFRAACLLPYFDIGLAAAAGAVPVGAVERLLSRQLHRTNAGSVYPYRIHDTLRAIVRAAGAKAAGGWAAADWTAHARLALAEARRRFDDAMASGDDLAAIDSLALGLNVATEHGLFDRWIVTAIRHSPTIQGLAPLISASPAADTPRELADVVEFLALRARPPSEDVTAGLLEIAQRHTAIGSSAALWRAYDLRKRGQLDESLAQLQMLLDEFGDRPSLYRMQYVTTLRLHRRFGDATELLPFLSEAQQDAQRRSLQRTHGHYLGSSAAFTDRVRRAKSRRYQVELLGDELAIRHRELGIDSEEIERVYATAVEVGHQGTQAVCLGLLAEVHLFDDEIVGECLDELHGLSVRRGRPYRAQSHVRAMRTLALGDVDAAGRAQELAALEPHRSASWIPTEILLERVGHPLEPVPTQWLEPYEEVRDRWLAIFETIVDRARAS